MSETLKYPVVLLDADETILDFKKSEDFAIKSAMKEFDIPFKEGDEKLYSRINKETWKSLERKEITREQLKTLRFSRFFQALGYEGVIDCKSFHNCYVGSLSRHGFMLAGAMDFLQELCKIAQVYIVTNGLAAAQKGRMRDSGVDRVVKKVFISEEVGYQKPEKEFFDKVFEDIGLLDRSKAIILGDSLTSDMQGGKNAGIATCLYMGNNDGGDWEKRLCDFAIREYGEFFDIVKYGNVKYWKKKY